MKLLLLFSAGVMLDGFQHRLSLPLRRRQNDQRYLAVPVETSREDDANSLAQVSEKVALRRAIKLGSVVVFDVFAPILIDMVFRRYGSHGDFFLTPSFDGINHSTRISKALERMGPTYVKFGQAIASRSDIIPSSLASQLANLQDDMQPFDDTLAKHIVRVELERSSLSSEDIALIMDSMTSQVVAAASIGQVYKAHLPGRGPVAIKVQRPGIQEIVEADSHLLRSIAEAIEKLPSPSRSSSRRLVATKLVASVDEFMTRMFEELDYENEAANMAKFAALFSKSHGSINTVNIVVPKVHADVCSKKIVVMEWVEGTKLVDMRAYQEEQRDLKENLELIQDGISSILTQLLSVGVMHADPHAGNLLKVPRDGEPPRIGFLDFGMLSTVPETVRDALVSAVALVVFERNTVAVAELFAELQLLPSSVVEDSERKRALSKALDTIFDNVLDYSGNCDGSTNTRIPVLRFDNLLGGLALLIGEFEFSLPPYFVNIARALATLEGVARKLDPSFNSLQAVYPFALDRILVNPSGSQVVEGTVLQLLRCKKSGRYSTKRATALLKDTSQFTGLSRWTLVRRFLLSRSGRSILATVLRDNMSRIWYRARSYSLVTNQELFRL